MKTRLSLCFLGLITSLFVVATPNADAQSVSSGLSSPTSSQCDSKPSGTDAESMAADAALKAVCATTRKMNSLRFECWNCTKAGRPAVAPACYDTYADLYLKPEINFSVTLGYSDNLFQVHDHARKTLWIDRLLRPCPKDENGNEAVGTCGFKRTIANPDLFKKVVRGPDGTEHTVNLSLKDSANTPDDRANRAPRTNAGEPTAQEVKTREAEDNFFNGMKTADVVIYAGHARKGAGPSFGPVKKNGPFIDYASLLKDSTNQKRMISSLRGDSTPPKFVGLFACDSGKYFAEDVRAATGSRSGVMSSTGLTFAEVAFAQAYAAVDSLLAMRCDDEFTGSVNAIGKIGTVPQGANLLGFFDDPHAHAWFNAKRDGDLQTPSSEAETRGPAFNITPIHPVGDAVPKSPNSPRSSTTESAN